jgi:hypothetical protein
MRLTMYAKLQEMRLGTSVVHALCNSYYPLLKCCDTCVWLLLIVQ